MTRAFKEARVLFIVFGYVMLFIHCMCLRENFPGMPGPLNSFVVDSDNRLVPPSKLPTSLFHHHHHQCPSRLPVTLALRMAAAETAAVKITVQCVDATRKT